MKPLAKDITQCGCNMTDTVKFQPKAVPFAKSSFAMVFRIEISRVAISEFTDECHAAVRLHSEVAMCAHLSVPEGS